MVKQTSNKYVSREKLEKELKKKYGSTHDFKIFVRSPQSLSKTEPNICSKQMRAYLGRHQTIRSCQK